MAVDKLVDSTLLDANLTSVANAIRAKGGTSAQMAFPAGFVSAVQAIPTGGGGATLVASGSFVGNTTNGRMTVPIGNTMPQTDFYLCVKAKDDAEFEQNENYTFTALTVLVISDFGHYDLSAIGNTRSFVSNFPVKNNKSGTITTLASGRIVKDGSIIRNGGTSEFMFNTFAIDRLANGFSIFIGHSNSLYKFPSTVTYEWEIVYFGSNPNADIITIS